MTFSRDWRGVNRIAADRESRLTAAPSARAHDPQYEQEHNRSDRGVNDEADDARAEMNPEAMQKPVADERANDANRRVADETEPVACRRRRRRPAKARLAAPQADAVGKARERARWGA